MAHTIDVKPLEVEPEDRELVEKLAKLQDMYNQIFELRTLLPDKLLNPTRAALENPGRYAPEKLAAYLKDAAIAGSKGIKTFKRDYHSDAMRELWQTANTSDYPQGRDGWTEDYVALVKGFEAAQNTSIAVSEPESGPPGLDKSEIDIVKDFREQHPHVKIELADDIKGLPLDISIDGNVFRIDSSSSAESRPYTISIRSAEQEAYLARDILDNIQNNHSGAGLTVLLGLLSSYQDIKSQRCEKCHKVFDQDLRFALGRKQQDTTTKSGETRWTAFHQNCV